MHKNLQGKLRAANALVLEARLADSDELTKDKQMSTLISIFCRLAYDHKNGLNFSNTTQVTRREPDPKRSRKDDAQSPVDVAVLECIEVISRTLVVEGIGDIASTVSQHNVFGTSSSRAEDPIDAARSLRNRESAHQHLTSTYPITLALLEWFKQCIERLMYQRTVVDLREKFNNFDKDGDGNITRLEFLNKLQEPPFTKRLSSATLRQLVAQFDRDGDDEVDYSEFVAFYFSQQSNQGGRNDVDDVGGNVTNISSDEVRAANTVADDLRHLFTQFTGRDPGTLASENMLVYKITSFVVETFVEHSNWRFNDEGHRYDISKVCLSIMHQILRYGDLGNMEAGTSAYDAREFLLEALLEDRSLQHRLMSSVTELQRHLDHSANQIQNEESTRKLAEMTVQAFDVLLDILTSDDANTASERTELAKLKLKLVAQHDDSRSSDGSDISGKISIITISGYASINDSKVNASTLHRLRICALKNMEELTSILAIVGATSRQSTVGIDRFTMLRRLQNQGGASRNGGRKQSWQGNTNGNNLSGGLDRLLTEDTLSTSLLSFYSKDEKDQLRKDLIDCVNVLEDSTNQEERKRKAELQCAVFSFVTACCHNQPNFGSFLLLECQENLNFITAVLNCCEKYYNEYPSVLASWYGLLNDIWDQGQGKRDQLLKICGDQQNFWEKVARPLLNQENDPLTLNTTSSDSSVSDYCHRMEACAFSLRLVASQMASTNIELSQTLEVLLLKKLRTSSLLEKWLIAFCRIESPSQVLSEASKNALKMGVNLALFANLPVPPPGSRKYGKDYVYDECLLKSILDQNLNDKSDDVYKNDNMRCMQSLQSSNEQLGLADARLFAIQSLKQFIEVYCIREVVVDELPDGDAKRHILTPQTLEHFEMLSSTQCNADSIVVQEIMQLLLILLHKKIFGSSPPNELKGNGNGVENVHVKRPIDLDADFIQKLMGIMEVWCNNMFGHNADEGRRGRLGSSNFSSHFNVAAIPNSTVSSPQVFEYFQIEAAKPLLASCVLSMHVMVEQRRHSNVWSPLLAPALKSVRSVVQHICACVEHVGAILTQPSRSAAMFHVDDLHSALQSGISLLSVYVSQPQQGVATHLEMDMGEVVNTLRYETLRVLVDVLWVLLDGSAQELDLHPNAVSTSMKIMSLIRELIAVKELADAIIQMGFLTRMLECPVFRHFQAEVMDSGGGQGQQWSFRGYDAYGDRRDVHRLWCSALLLIPGFLNTENTSISTRQLAFGQVLDVVTIYECSFVDLLEAPLQHHHRFSRASLMETRCAAAVIASLVKDDQNAQRWRLAKPTQFEQFIQGLLRVVSSMAHLVRLDGGDNFEGLWNVRKKTRSVSTLEQHETILKLHDIWVRADDRIDNSGKSLMIRRRYEALVMETNDYHPYVYVMDHVSNKLLLVHINKGLPKPTVDLQVQKLKDAGADGFPLNDGLSMCVGVFEQRGNKELIGALQVDSKTRLTDEHKLRIRDKASKLRVPLSFQIGDVVTYRGDKGQHDRIQGHNHGRSNILEDVGEIVQVIETQQRMSFRVRFEKRFLKDCLNDATKVLEVVLPIVCLPSLSPFDPKTQRGLVEIMFQHSQREKLDIAFFCAHSLKILHEESETKLRASICGEIVGSESPLRQQYWRYIRLLSQSLYLFWNHLERTRLVRGLTNRDGLDDASFGKHQMHTLEKGLRIITDASRRPRSRSRLLSRMRARSTSAEVDDSAKDESFQSKMDRYFFLNRDNKGGNVVNEKDERDLEERKDSRNFLVDVANDIEKHFHLTQSKHSK
jgi:hypothetical protein